ncbi:MAG TPA: enoyl-CoA hydratase-related protein [Mycobacteriales bacterium]|nr:enoyl-CoA hydratase-related protein [Mycobacteriales bacterium]
MTEQTVLYEVDEAGVALLTLNRPEKLNAFTGDMQRRYCRLLVQADQDPAVRAVVVTGAGRGFCAGADLEALATISDGSFLEQDADPVDLGAPLHLSVPVVAAVNGAVAGMGFSYMLMADIRFASDTARMGTTFARLGLVAEWGSAPLLTALVGSANAADLLLSGRMIDAAEALRLGVVQRVCTPETLLAEALGYARDLAQNCSPISHAEIKEQLRDTTIRQQFEDSVQRMLRSFQRPDLAEALEARTQQRAPRFAPRTTP